MPLLFFSCSKTIINNGVKVSGIIKEKNIELPIINNIITDQIYEDPYEPVIQNDILCFDKYMIRILLLPDSNIDLIKLTAANGEYEFTYKPEFRQIYSYFNRGINIGYYCDIFPENKSWISKGSDWIFSLFDNDNLIIEKTIPLLETDNVLYIDYEEPLFHTINLRYVNKNQEYTFRYAPEKTDTIVIYQYHDEIFSGFYFPICVFSTAGRNNEIKIEWLDESQDGMYCIRTYSKLNIPHEEKTEAVFDFYDLNHPYY
jgi:hypothetical protein